VPYLNEGPSAMPMHTGPLLYILGIATCFIYIGAFCVRFGCFMFPCLCAPEIPGWMMCANTPLPYSPATRPPTSPPH